MTSETPQNVFRYCPRCGGALEPRVLEEGHPAHLVCVKCAFIFYADPKVVACVITMQDGKIVLLRRSIEPARGKWVFPGGFVDRGETVQAAAVRETLEEVNLRVGLTGILDVYSYAGHGVVIVVYAADVLGGELRPGVESLDVACFAPENVPWDELAFPSTRDALRDYLRRFYPRVRVPR